ncbi:MAG: phenylacetate--CoA ligase family protein [Verrucomicrobiota bacterium]
MKKSFSKKNLWEAVPVGLKGPLGSLIGVVPLPRLLGKTYRQWDALVAEADTWSRRQIESFQLARLREICGLAYEKSAYYRDSFDRVGLKPSEIQRCEDIRVLPIIDKQMINCHRDALLTVDPAAPGLDYVATGGSGGEPMRFLIGKDRSAIEYAHLARSWMRVGYAHGIPKAVIRGQVLADRGDGLHYAYDPLLRNHGYSNFHLNDDTMARYLEHISGIGPCFLHTYPSTLAMLVRFMKRHNLRGPSNLRGLLLESENVHESDREAAELQFGVRYFSSYGHSEKLVMAAECEHSSDYHVFPTYGYFELVDEAGNPVTEPGKEGEIVGTGFINHAMPFIRYRTGDYATYVGNSCEACGRQHSVISGIRGHRTMERLIAMDGSSIPYSAVNVHDDTFEDVLQFQFRQEVPGKATLRLVPAKANVDIQKIISTLEARLQGRVALTAEVVVEIALTARGKSIFVDQRVKSLASDIPSDRS